MSFPPRVDWQQIKNAWPGNDDRVLIIDNRAIHLLLSIFPRLNWLATYDHDDLAADDWDYIQRILASAELALGTAMRIQDLVQYIDEVEDLLRALKEQAGCCGPADPSDGDYYTDDVEDGVGDVPQNIVDAGYASSASDWEGFYDFKCMIMHLWVYQVESDLRQLAPYVSTAGVIIGGIAAIAGIISTIATGGAVLALGVLSSYVVASGVSAGLLALFGAGVEDLADSLAENHDELVCAMYEADGSSAAIQAWNDKVDELYNEVEATLLKNMNVKARVKALYAARYDQQDIAQEMADNGLDPADYDCSCLPPTPEGDVWGVSFLVKRFTATYNLPTLWTLENGYTSSGMISSPSFDYGNPSAFNGCTGPTCTGNDCDPIVRVYVSNAAGIADAGAGMKFTKSIRPPASRAPGIDFIHFMLDANNGGVETMEIQLTEWLVWVSNDDGATGEWWPAEVALHASDEGWSANESEDSFNFYRVSSGGDFDGDVKFWKWDSGA